MNNTSVEQIVALLKEKDDFVLLSHTNPDGDTVGSVTALCLALRKAGKRVRCLCDIEIPERLRFICGGLYDKDFEIKDYEYVISVDVAAPLMLGKSLDTYAQRVDIKIDHHLKGTDFGKLIYVEPGASSAGEIIFDICVGMNLFDPAIASAIYAAISSDTGCFRYSNTTAKTHMTAAYLITMGAAHSEISEALFETVSYRELGIYPLFLKNSVRLYDERVLIVTVSAKDKLEFGLSDADLDELSSLSRKVSGTQLGIVIKQLDGSDNEFKVSMRSRRQVDCSVICASIGGGGHTRASGATVTADSIEEAKNTVMRALEKTLVFRDR